MSVWTRFFIILNELLVLINNLLRFSMCSSQLRFSSRITQRYLVDRTLGIVTFPIFTLSRKFGIFMCGVLKMDITPKTGVVLQYY